MRNLRKVMKSAQKADVYPVGYKGVSQEAQDWLKDRMAEGWSENDIAAWLMTSVADFGFDHSIDSRVLDQYSINIIEELATLYVDISHLDLLAEETGGTPGQDRQYRALQAEYQRRVQRLIQPLKTAQMLTNVELPDKPCPQCNGTRYEAIPIMLDIVVLRCMNCGKEQTTTLQAIEKKGMAEIDDPFEDRLGNCFELAVKYQWHVERDSDKKDVRVVHGSIQGGGNPRIAHAWVEFIDLNLREQMDKMMQGKVSDDQLDTMAIMAHDAVADDTLPADAYYSLYQAIPEYSYDADQARRLMLSQGHFGPWDDVKHQYNKLKKRSSDTEWHHAPDDMEEYCERCLKPIVRGKERWLELDQTSGQFLGLGESLPEGHVSQGMFPFGPECYKKPNEPHRSKDASIRARNILASRQAGRTLRNPGEGIIEHILNKEQQDYLVRKYDGIIFTAHSMGVVHLMRGYRGPMSSVHTLCGIKRHGAGWAQPLDANCKDCIRAFKKENGLG